MNLRCLVVALLAVTSSAVAAPAPATWADVPALLASATTPVEADLRTCVGDRLPHPVALIASRGRDGATRVAMPMPAVGVRGFTREELCLSKTIARIALPPLPAALERISLRHVITAPGTPPAAPEPAFADWRDPAAAVAKLLDAPARAALAACDRKARAVRLVLDLRKGATRVWLPAWQFHAPTGDGTTPPAERRVKTCLTTAIRRLKPPPLPRTMAELQLAIPVAP